MLGAITGDIVGSRFEWDNCRSKNFDFFVPHCIFTDDSVMTLAIAKAIMESKEDLSDLGEKAVFWMQKIGRNYPHCGYGGHFHEWMFSDNPKPYNSYGNGAAMRVSACGFAAKSFEEAVTMAKKVTEVTHNHKEGIKGAVATASTIFLARTGLSKNGIWEYIREYFYNIDFTLDEIRDTYEFSETCQDTVPQAIEAFLESNDYEDAIRNAVSIGGDSDTLAAITGGIAEAYYGVPSNIRKRAINYLDFDLLDILNEFESKYKPYSKTR